MAKLVIISGAGLSAESGIPTFRASDGLWENHPVQEVCYFPTWKQNREKVHAFYNERRAKLVGVKPNIAHGEIVRWHYLFPQVACLTQNIDDLIERASGGTLSPIHLHGRLQWMQCTACTNTWSIGYNQWNPETDRCPRCDSIKGVKPGVVFFGEPAPEYARLWKTVESLSKEDVLVIIGTSGVVLPILEIVGLHPGTSILNNLEEEECLPTDHFTHTFYEPASTALPKITPILQSLLK